MSGKLIRLFLVDGNPNGLRTLEISNMTIYGTIFPRTKLKAFLSRDEAKKPGTYILLGNNIDDTEKTTAYIGEGDPVEARLKAHSSGKSQKEFWEEAIVFTSKDDYITKTQIQYLESELYRLAFEADKVELENTQIPSKPKLSEVDNAEIQHFLEGLKLILSSVDIDILESSKVIKDKKEEVPERIFKFKIKNINARMKIEEEKYIVLKESTAVLENRPSARDRIIKTREDLETKGIIKINLEKTLYIFQEDYIFNSPSHAASAISGGSENGRKVWKYNGMNLNELEEKEIENLK